MIFRFSPILFFPFTDPIKVDGCLELGRGGEGGRVGSKEFISHGISFFFPGNSRLDTKKHPGYPSTHLPFQLTEVMVNILIFLLDGKYFKLSKFLLKDVGSRGF